MAVAALRARQSGAVGERYSEQTRRAVSPAEPVKVFPCPDTPEMLRRATESHLRTLLDVHSQSVRFTPGIDMPNRVRWAASEAAKTVSVCPQFSPRAIGANVVLSTARS